MPVTSPDPTQGAQDYEETLVSWAGKPPVLDLIHLGLGADAEKIPMGARLLAMDSTIPAGCVA